MSQKIKVQDGTILYSSVPSDTNPLGEITVGVNGQINVSNEIVVGSVNSPIDGVISTGDGTALNRAQLDITTGAYGDMFINQSPTDGALYLNNTRWPRGAVQAAPGMFLGASNVNELEYYPFVIGYNPNNSLTETDLNLLYPDIQPGQSVAGPTVLYMCVSTGQWRTLGSASGSAYTPPEEFIALIANTGTFYADGISNFVWTSTVHQASAECTVNDFGSEDTAVFTLTTAGIYKVTITGRIRPLNYPTGNLTIQSMFYGINVTGAEPGFNLSTHQSGDAYDGWPTNLVQNQIQWTDTFYIMNYNGGATFNVGVFANDVTGLFIYDSSCMVSVVRTNGTPIQPF